ncbi:MAG: hypothetical protein FH756_13315 [Firmicutes bacterium]|nr:hypothetical protein [Bacillota bacterium]
MIGFYTIPLNTSSGIKNNKKFPLDVPAMIIDGRTMVPTRVIAESMGEKVEWDGSTNTVIVGSRAQKSLAVLGEPGTKFNDELVDSNGKVVYKGSTLNGMKHGWGEYFYADGSTYKGNWYKDKQQGLGTLTYFNGGKYEGQWRSGSQHGLGTLTFANGGKYVGQWNYGKRHGLATYTWADGDVFVGQYSNDIRHGYGVMTWASGQVYKGQYVNGERAN